MTATDGPEAPIDGPAVGATALVGRRRRSLLVVALAALAVAVATLMSTHRPDGTIGVPSTTAHVSVPAESARVTPVTAEIATARVSTVAVSATEPPDWAVAQRIAGTGTGPAPPASQALVPARAPLPRPDYPIQGRHASTTGWQFQSPTAFGGPLTFLVTERRGDWVEVMVPVRPNGTEGWIRASDVVLSTTTSRLDVHIADRKLRVVTDGHVVAETGIVVGTDQTPTPTGRFYVTDIVRQGDPGGFYGPYALALNGYSERLDVFHDGVPVIALHGTNRPDLIGTAASNGCVRIPNEVVATIAATVIAGTPVDIWP